jgi:hypothetical protein
LNKKFVFSIIVVLMLLFVAFGSAMALDASCKFTPGQGWHIVPAKGGNQSFATEAECLAALNPVPTEPSATEPPVTEEPTIEPTEEPTEVPTEVPTDVPTEVSPTDEPVQTPVVSNEQQGKSRGNVNICLRAWNLIHTENEKQAGYNIFQIRPYCKVWVLKHFGETIWIPNQYLLP